MNQMQFHNQGLFQETIGYSALSKGLLFFVSKRMDADKRDYSESKRHLDVVFDLIAQDLCETVYSTVDVVETRGIQLVVRDKKTNQLVVVANSEDEKRNIKKVLQQLSGQVSRAEMQLGSLILREMISKQPDSMNVMNVEGVLLGGFYLAALLAKGKDLGTFSQGIQISSQVLKHWSEYVKGALGEKWGIDVGDYQNLDKLISFRCNQIEKRYKPTSPVQEKGQIWE
ncbi:MAG: hypothetical protein EZS28_024900 [Streblomastix strix]|uniref:Uncharacterized protein n=1 Tax=Streblomastix strix TaxID=222440 RepID=A0A5J4VAQ2_9EUKA|nr:MAG: hypothetical protein EZS28_024900 [Streblomastix strix]